MDNRFQAVKSLPPSDYHEFLVPEPYDNAIVSVYQPVQRDLTAFGVLSGRGWVVNSRFKQLRLATNETVFDWASLDHVPLSEGTVPPGRTSTGLSETFAWDYFHLNSVDTLPNGDFLVSSRHTSTVYRISGRDGSIVWRLGGRTSTFALTNFNFTFQHDARYVRGSESGSTLTLTLFDNAYNGITARDSDSSSGKVIRINTATRTAELLVQLNFPDPPTTPFLSSDGGSVQALDGGNYFVGWGSNAYVTEHSPNGNCIYVANFGSGSSAASYRAFKGPLQDILAGSQVNDDSLLPDVFAYAHNTSAPTMVYVSWNGDHYTESWSIYGLDSPSGPPTTQEYRVNKSGFETTFTIPTFHRYVAVGPNPNVRGFSNSTVATFVPGPELANECNDFGCRDA
ncbi:MAG: hypothetical protein LQ342_004705 [Letrouitia transgressa]|nr:MAG: hypothetical protein LQ342_004705 [Letrouitia transgressa]